ncbi:ferritin-like domain-containing protein [Streptomyces sp. Inha503]|uniref:ferritin-like domain-containing protein n=1 Tax=Streptomyces sp. Inha503 TaxID=3383314 RepID=UPI0039A21538
MQNKDTPITTIQELKDHLQKALAVELATIPAYLSGWFTIRNRQNYGDVLHILRSITVTEMRHLAVVANTLIAVDGTPDIKAAALTYPHQLPMIDTIKLVRLLPFGDAYWNQGLAIEQPDPPTCPPFTTGEYHPETGTLTGTSTDISALVRELPRLVPEAYMSIGDFYKAVIDGIDYLVQQKGAGTVFPEGRLGLQYRYFGGQDNISVRAGEDGADDAKALLLDIIEEGEGSKDRMWDENRNLSHYYSFDQLRKRRLYKYGDAECTPTGGDLSLPSNSDVVRILDDPMMCKYDKDPSAWKAADTFNRFYGKILDNLNIGFSGHLPQVDAAIGQMHQLDTLAQDVLKQPVKNSNPPAFAAPTFELPPYRGKPIVLPAEL